MNTEALAELLRKIPVFRDAGHSLHELASKMSLLRVAEGEHIFREGEHGFCLYVIVSGKVLIYTKAMSGKEVNIQTLGQSDFFGEMSILDGGYRSASARVLVESILFCMERREFLEFLHLNPQVAEKIIEVLAKRIRQANARIKILNDERFSLQGLPTKLSTEITEKHDINTEQIIKNGDHLSFEEREDNIENEEPFAYVLEQRFEVIKKESIKETEQKNDTRKEIDYKDMLYYKKVVCQICQTEFKTPKAFSKYVFVKKIDNDFCKYYELINPLLYEIMICPACGFAFNDDIAAKHISDKQREKIKLLMKTIWQDQKIKNYCGLRSLEQAIETFILVLSFLEGRPLEKSKEGMFNLKMAWLHRFKNDIIREHKYIKKAVLLLSEAYQTEDLSSKSTIDLAYLIGVLNMRIGEYREAAVWLEQILRHPSKSSSPSTLDKTRDLWIEVKKRVSKIE